MDRTNAKPQRWWQLKVQKISVCALMLSGLLAPLLPAPPAISAESTLPEKYNDPIKPEYAAKYTYREDGELSKQIGLPTYEWMPVDQIPQSIVIGVHGLTLHGRSYRVLARALAVNGIGFVSMDMRGFGRCKFDDKKEFSSPTDDRTKVDHEKSYQDVAKLLASVRLKYPGMRIIVLGESLGCTFAVRAAADHPELVDGIVLSAPAVRVNSKMYASSQSIAQGVKAAFSVSGVVNLQSFLKTLVTQRQEVRDELLDDPFIVKELPLTALLSTDLFVEKTAGWGKLVHPHLPVLILQGSNDNCVAAKHVTDLMDNMRSDDQTLAWRGTYGHLQLETMYLRPAMLDALADWLGNHGVENQQELATMQESIGQLGGRLSP